MCLFFPLLFEQQKKKDGQVLEAHEREQRGNDERGSDRKREKRRESQRESPFSLMERASAMLFPLITLMTNLKQFKSHFGGSPSPLASPFLLFSSIHIILLFLTPLSRFLISPLLLSPASVIPFFLVESGICLYMCAWVSSSKLHICLC